MVQLKNSKEVASKYKSEVNLKTRIQKSNEEINNQGIVLWLTGLSGSGKSTTAAALEQELFNRNIKPRMLDGDVIRTGLCKDLGFSAEDRKENIRRISEVAKLFVDIGSFVVVSFISPYRIDRDLARALIPEGRFIEVYIDCPVEECERRDVKGLYAKARAGEISNFTGISAPYEAPINPEIRLKTHENSVEEGVSKILRYLEI